MILAPVRLSTMIKWDKKQRFDLELTPLVPPPPPKVCMWEGGGALHLSGALPITSKTAQSWKTRKEALPGVLGIQGEGLFIFRDLGRRVIYFQGFGEILRF